MTITPSIVNIGSNAFDENSNLKIEIINLKKTIKLKEEENEELKSRIDILINKSENKPKLVDFDKIKII